MKKRVQSIIFIDRKGTILPMQDSNQNDNTVNNTVITVEDNNQQKTQRIDNKKKTENKG